MLTLTNVNRILSEHEQFLIEITKINKFKKREHSLARRLVLWVGVGIGSRDE